MAMSPRVSPGTPSANFPLFAVWIRRSPRAKSASGDASKLAWKVRELRRAERASRSLFSSAPARRERGGVRSNLDVVARFAAQFEDAEGRRHISLHDIGVLDGVYFIALVEPNWAGIERVFAFTKTEDEIAETYEAPLTPWGAPDMQGIWTANAAHGIPLERPEDVTRFVSELLEGLPAHA